MMEGLTLLSVGEGIIKGASWNSNCAILLVPIGIFVIIGIIGIITDDGEALTAGIVGILFFGGMCYYCYCTDGVAGTYPIYKVTIDESVPLAEFNERYEILSQEGLIYEIKERIE